LKVYIVEETKLTAINFMEQNEALPIVALLFGMRLRLFEN